MSDQDYQRSAPLPLWRAASGLLRTLFALFGDPERLAAQHTITGPTYRLILNWLHCAEALMRHLLFIEASAFPAGDAHKRRGAKRQRERREMSFDADTPENWRVSFRCALSRGRRVAPSRRNTKREDSPYAAPVSFHSAWPLAERFEALLRVHNDPEPYARRLARRLHAAPKAIAALLAYPAELIPRIGDDIFAAIRVACGERKPIFDSS